MRFFFCLFVCVLSWQASGAELTFDFGDYPEGTTPTNFESVLHGGGPPPGWTTVGADLPSVFQAFGSKTPLMNHSTVLAQTNQDMTDERYPMFVYRSAKFADFTFETKFETVNGIREQMAGLVFRYQNSSNFYLVRVSVLGKNICFYKVINGDIVTSPAFFHHFDISSGTWHDLKVDVSGIYIVCSIDGQNPLPTITDKDAIHKDGKIGFWTKSDSVTYFTDAKVTYAPRIPPAQEIVNGIIEDRSKLLGLQIYTLNGTNSTRILASKYSSEIGKQGSDAELLAIQSGTVSLGWDHGTVIVTMPLHDRNGEFIAAMRVKLKSFFGETQDNAVTRARMVQQDIEQFTTSADNLRN